MDVHVTKKDETVLIGNVSYITHAHTFRVREREFPEGVLQSCTVSLLH